MSFWIRQKIVLFQRKSALFSSESVLFQKKSMMNQRCSALILSSEKFSFRGCSELNQRCSEFFKQWTALKQTWNYDIILNQSWSALNVSETSTRVFLIGNFSRKMFFFPSFPQISDISRSHFYVYFVSPWAQVNFYLISAVHIWYQF